jgi:hypothetical protein
VVNTINRQSLNKKKAMGEPARRLRYFLTAKSARRCCNSAFCEEARFPLLPSMAVRLLRMTMAGPLQ